MADQFATETMPTRIEDERRELAIQRLKGKHEFRLHLVASVLVNAALIVLWYLTSGGAEGNQGFFWPVFPLVGWGIGLALHAYITFVPPSLSEADIQSELKRLQ